jgi:hypothetical protein
LSRKYSSILARTYVESKVAQTSASWLSGGLSQRPVGPQAARSFG